jgi:glutathionyl-hydroquinone reductase
MTLESFVAEAKTAMDEISQDGAFKRTESVFRNWIKKVQWQMSTSPFSLLTTPQSQSLVGRWLKFNDYNVSCRRLLKSEWRNMCTLKHIQGSVEYPPEAGRYQLYVSYACPWVCIASHCIARTRAHGNYFAQPVFA